MRYQVAVIGMGMFGREVALSLARRGFAVMAIDRDAERIDQVKDQVAQALILDTTSETALLDAKVDDMAVVVNAIGTDHIENSILTTALLHQLEIPRIIARATNELHERILRQVGATEVVNPEQDMGRKLAAQIARPGLREVLNLAEGVCVAELPVPHSFVGKTLEELEVRRKYGVTVVGVQRVNVAMPHGTDSGDGDTGPPAAVSSPEGARLLDVERRLILNIAPSQDRFLADDELVVIGREEDVNRLAGLG